MVHNYAPCDICTEKIKEFLSENSGKISGLCIKYRHAYTGKDKARHENFLFLLLPIDGVEFTVTVTRFSNSPPDHVDQIQLRRELDDLFLKVDPYECNRTFGYDSAVDKSNLKEFPDKE